MIAGKDKGKTGTVLRAFPKKDQILIDGVNVIKKHQRGRRANQAGQIIERPMSIHVSNVAIAEKGGVSRVGYKVEEGKKVRIAKKSRVKI